MIFIYSPVRSDAALELSRFGDTVIVNGAPLDLSVIPEGGSLPSAAIETPYIVGSVERQNGILSMTWLVPIGADAVEDAAFPPLGVSIQADGPVTLPGRDAAIGLPATEPAIVVDLSQLVTPETRTVDARTTAYLPRREFARALAVFGIIPFPQATAFATGSALPDKAQAYIDGLPEADRDLAVFTILTADNVYRNDPHVLSLASAEGLTVEVMDSLFGIA